MSQIDCLLWDFGDTLCDEWFIWSAGDAWLRAYRTFDDGYADAWNLGEMSDEAFADKLSPQLDLPPAQVLATMVERCRAIDFYPNAFRVFREVRMRQAIVTINPPLFSSVIVPHYHLNDYADTIVTSWKSHSLDKSELCRITLLNLGRDKETALLIDNRRDNVEDWRQQGGLAYHFVDDESFARDLHSAGIDALARPAH